MIRAIAIEGDNNTYPVERVVPLPARNEQNYEPWPSATQTAGHSNSAVSYIPLEIINASASGTAKAAVIYGNVDNVVADADMAGGHNAVVNVANGNHVWVQFACSYDDTTNLWTRTGDPECLAGSLPDPTDVLAVFDLGSVTVAGGNVTALGAVKPGSLQWERCGPTDNFGDHWSH